MSQAGIVDIEVANPQIPTSFETNNGTAIPIANKVEILGSAVAAHSIPVETVGSGNTVTLEVQRASGASTSIAANAGLASFDSTDFSIDANGFVTFTGGGGSSKEGVSLFVVDSAGNAGYTTIQAAIDAAALVATSTTPQTVWVWPGTYIEDLTLVDFVNLGAASTSFPVIVNGSSTYNSASGGTFCAENITFSDRVAGSPTILISGTSSPTVFFNNCQIIANYNTAFSAEGNQSAVIYLQSCTLSCSNYDLSIFSFTDTNFNGALICLNIETDSTNIGSLIECPITARFSNCVLNDTFTISLGATVFFRSCSFNPINQNGYPIFNISDDSNTYVQAYHCEVRCNTSPWATGPGKFYFNGLIVDDSNNQGLIDSSLQITNYLHISGPISFDLGNTTLNPVTQAPVNQVVLGTGTSALNVVSGTGTTGQVLTSNGSGADPTWQDSGGGAISSIYVDLGGPVSGSIISLFALNGDGSAVGGSTLAFSASSSTEIDLQTTDSNQNTMIGEDAGTNALSTNGVQNTAFGYGALGSGDSGTLNTAVGYEALNQSQSDQGNTAIGWGSLTFLNGGSDNTAVGFQALNSSTEDSNNSCLGMNSLLVVNGGSYNSALGFEAGFGVVTGSFNTYLGFGSGSAHASDESSNLIIGSTGVAGDQNLIRIGNQGTDVGEQNSCYIAGIYNNDSSGFTSPLPVYVDSSTGQLGYGALSSSFNSINVQTFTSSGTYTPTSGMVYCVVEIIGGGGGGGSCSSTSSTQVSAGGGGGGGSYCRKTFSGSTIGASQTVTIGSGGSGGASGGQNNGATGGTTTFGSLLSASGGVGGMGADAFGASSQMGGVGGTASGGDINIPGASGIGSSSGYIAGISSFGISGAGANGIYGAGGLGRTTIGTTSEGGNGGSGYGAGGSGAICSQGGASAAGGDGSDGIVIITEYIA